MGFTGAGRLSTAVLLTLSLSATPASAQQIRVTLLGTGNPTPTMDRFGPSILIEAGGRKFLFDAGRGALQRLTQAQIRWQDIDGVFLTHLHSDHVVGLPDVWLTGWLVSAGRNRPLRVWGPKGTESMTSHLAAAYEFDIRARIADHSAPDGVVMLADDIEDGEVFREGGLTITAFDVDHGSVAPALGYRIDFGGRSVVLSGDTRVSESLARHAEGVDLLVHEVVVPEALVRAGLPPGRVSSIVAVHATPEQAGEVFTRTKPRLAVYSHIVPFGNENDIIAPTRRTYSGPLELGEDLMVIEVGEKIEVRRPRRPTP